MSARPRRVSASLAASLFFVCLLHNASLTAESWSAPLLSRELVIVEKARPGSGFPAGPLPASLMAELGSDFVEYESFVAVRLAPEAATDLMKTAREEGFGVLRDTRPPIHLPFRELDPGSPDTLPDGWEGSTLRSAPVSGTYVVRFAFPLEADWTDALASG